MKGSLLKSSASFFGLLCIIFIPFPFYLIQVQISITDFVFGKLIGIISKNIFGHALSNTRVYSDTISMYILILVLFILALLFSFILFQLEKKNLYLEKVAIFSQKVFVFYLSLQLLKYGADKIFKNQFYIPEPNTLYTPVGKMSKGLLYWSSMGSSHFYSVFLGMSEAIAAIFIFIKRTRLAGLLISLAIMLNVIAVNFGFDISVKLYSLFLLFLTVYLLSPYFARLYNLLWSKKSHAISVMATTPLTRNIFLAAFLKCFAACIICLEVFYPFIKNKNYNSDTSQMTYLHGAYEVKNIVKGNDTLSAETSPVKRFFIHKDSYIIFQDKENEMQDYKLNYDKLRSVFILTDYTMKQVALSFSYQSSDSILTLQYDKDTKLIGKAVDWRRLPLLKKDFHWTADGN